MPTHALENQNNPALHVLEPELSPRTVKAAVVEPDGPELCVHSHMSDFEALNPTSGAEGRRRAAAARHRELDRAARQAAKHLRRTTATRTITSRVAVAALPRFSIIEASALLIGALLALYVSNLVLATYAVMSGNDLFASDLPGARMFAVVPFLAALGIKAFEKRLSTDITKASYATAFYVVAVASFVIWATTGALLFAPKATAGSWLTHGGPGSWVPIALMLAHVIGDCAWGFILFSGAERLLLGNRQRIVIANPEYALAQERERQAQVALAACLKEIADAEAYLQAVAKCRQKLQARAELELDRMAALWRESQAAAVAYARAAFLNSDR